MLVVRRSLVKITKKTAKASSQVIKKLLSTEPNPSSESSNLQVMSWQPLPLHRHLATVGIGPVFVCPPQHCLPQHRRDDADAHSPPKSRMSSAVDNSNDGEDGRQQQQKQAILTWEITGNIKTAPRDFIVREIGLAPSKSLANSNEQESDQEQCNKIIHNWKANQGRVWCRRIAGLECELSCNTCQAQKLIDADDDSPLQTAVGDGDGPSNAKKVKLSDDAERIEANDNTQSPSKSSSPLVQEEQSTRTQTTTKPLEKLKQILLKCTQKSTSKEEANHQSETTKQETVDGLFEKLTALQNLADNEISNLHSRGYSGSQSHDGDENSDNNNNKIDADEKIAVWIPTSRLFDSTISSEESNKEDWRLLHQSIREVFPFLRTEVPLNGRPISANDSNAEEGEVAGENSINSEEDGKEQNNTHTETSQNSSTKPWVCALIDRSFFPLAPYLHNPNVDLLELYKFRQHGPVSASAAELRDGRGDSRGGRGGRGGGNRNRKWKGGRFQRDQRSQSTQQNDNDEVDGANNEANSIASSEGLSFLRLRVDLPKEERRNIHKIISGGGSQRREFDTFTKNDVPLDDSCGVDGDGKTTTAVVVHWSSKALKASQKKRKRTNDNSSDVNAEESIQATFCVLRKEGVEHQVANQHVARALNCKPHDVGLAGIKDMQAITYQFCTLRNISIERAKRANRVLAGKRVELSHFEDVRGRLLNRGDLLGNRFEIVVKNLKRIEQMPSDKNEDFSGWKERAVSCNASHLDAMVKRVGESGFVNFYGEQRVGDAGHSNRVGVRSFDIGRAMLKQNFSEAIDLIMTGRSSEVYQPSEEEIKARELWKSSGGDARATLDAFPKSQSTMVRERDLMKGLVRYGEPLEAIQCIPRNVRLFWIHAYQSYVWNIIATERIKRLGLRPIVGDLYCGVDGSSDDDEGRDVQIVKDPDAVSIHQVVLPLPGYNMKYPSNEIGELYETILKNDGVDLTEKCSIQEATAKGSYRKLLQKANNLTWENVSDNCDVSVSEGEDPVVEAARFTFELESGCYATMMLRELMVTTMARDGKIKS